jgi:hypothetical protein
MSHMQNLLLIFVVATYTMPSCKHFSGYDVSAKGAAKATAAEVADSKVIYYSTLLDSKDPSIVECNAIAISKYIIATAAHCVYSVKDRRQLIQDEMIKYSNAASVPSPLAVDYPAPYQWNFAVVVDVLLHPSLSEFLDSNSDVHDWNDVRIRIVPDLALVVLGTPLSPAIKYAELESSAEIMSPLVLMSYGPKISSRTGYADRELSLSASPASSFLRLSKGVFAIQHSDDLEGLVLKGDSGGPILMQQKILGLATYSDPEQKRSIYADVSDELSQSWVEKIKVIYEHVRCQLTLRKNFEAHVRGRGYISIPTFAYKECPTFNSLAHQAIDEDTEVEALSEDIDCPAKATNQLYTKVLLRGEPRFVDVQALYTKLELCEWTGRGTNRARDLNNHHR